tara:strand:+ start:439 stop:705 length:267 start_codon:yes stop_codon:yes gene_type:complete
VKFNDLPQEDNRCTGDCEQFEELELVNKLGITDKVLGKIISRKLLVFGTATGLLMWYGLDPDTWGLIAMIYVGGQSIIDTVKVWKHGE